MPGIIRGIAPSFPFGRAALVPRQQRQPRTQCLDCAGGGEINGVPCLACESRGWHDAANPLLPERR